MEKLLVLSAVGILFQMLIVISEGTFGGESYFFSLVKNYSFQTKAREGRRKKPQKKA